MKGWVFEFVCPGNARRSLLERLLIQWNGAVNRNLGLHDICKERHVNIAYSERADYLWVNNKTGYLIEWPPINLLAKTINSVIPYPWEILNAFMEKNHIHPHWFDVGDEPSFLTGEGEWRGGTGMIQRDEVDFRAAQIMDSYSIVAMGKCCHISPAIRNIKYHWFSRLPQKISPTWNLLYLFPEELKLTFFYKTESKVPVNKGLICNQWLG